MPLRPDMEPQEYLAILARRNWISILAGATIFLGASIFCVVVPEKFKSTTTILVVPQRVPEGYVKSTISVRIEDRLSTIQQQVMSRTRLTAVMDEVGLFKNARRKKSIEELIELMRKRIEIQVGPVERTRRNRDAESDSFTLSFTHENRHLAMLTTARLASFFIDENLRNREQQAVGTSEFLQSQLVETKARLEAAEEKVRQYKMRFTGELPQQVQTSLQVLSRLQDQLRVNADATRTAEDRKIFLQSQITLLESHIREIEKTAPQTDSPSDPAGEADDRAPDQSQAQDPADSMVRELAAKQLRLADLNARFTPRYPEVIRLTAEVEKLQKDIESVRSSAVAVQKSQSAPPAAGQMRRTRPRVNPAPVVAARERDEVRQLKAQLAQAEQVVPSLKKERNDFLKEMASIEGRVAQSPKREQEMISLTRDYDNLKASYDDLLRKKLDSDVSQNLEKRQKGEQFQILDPANLPEEAFFPNRKKVLGLSLLAAIAIGLGSGFLLEMIDPTLRTVKDFRHYFPTQIIASIPQIQKTESELKRLRKRDFVLGAIAAFELSFCLALLLLTEKIRILIGIGGGG